MAVTDSRPRPKDNSDTGDLFLKLQNWVLDGQARLEDQRNEQREAYRFYAGHQWSDDDRKKLEGQLRPVITFNRTGVVVDSVIGLEINNRERTQYYPREMGDVKVSELMSSAAMWVRDETNAEDEETDAFMDLVICGLGWMEDTIVTDEASDGEINIGMGRIDPLEMGYDPTAKKRNLIDARYKYRIREVPADEAENLIPGRDLTDIDAGWASGRKSMSYEDSRVKYTDDKTGEKNKGVKTVTVVEIRWWERETFYKVEDPFTGEVANYDKASFDEINKKLGQVSKELELNHAKYQRKVYKRAYLGATDILKQTPTPCPYSDCWHVMTGKRDHDNSTWYGMVRAMMDPQMWSNKWLSQILHIINTNAKGGIMARKTDFDDWRDVESNWARPDFIAWLSDTAKPGNVEPRPTPQFPASLQYLMEFAVSSLRDVTGANVELLGLADKNQPASLEYQRRQAGVTVLAGFFNSLRQYRKQQGRCLLYMIQKWVSDGRLIRITGGDGKKQYQPLMKSPDVVEYDVIVDEAPSSPNQKEAVWSMLIQAIPLLSNAPMSPEIWAEFIRYSPLPDGLAEKIANALTKPPDPEQMMAQKATQQATIALMQAEAQKTAADAQKSAQQAQTEPVNRMAKAAGAQKDMAETQGINVETMLQRLEALERGMRGMTVRPQPELQPQPQGVV